MEIKKADKCYLTDVVGNTYIDTTMGSGAQIIGHNNPLIKQISEQIGKGTIYTIPNCHTNNVNHYLKEFPPLGSNRFLINDFKIKKIPEGGGFHNWHFEDNNIQNSNRYFVVQIYLNEDFEGGETEFLYFNKRIKPKRGRLIIFPCSFTHTHRGNPPIGGTKYLASTWGLMQSKIGNNSEY